MGKKGRGRERLETCDICGRQVPRNRIVEFDRVLRFGTDMDEKELDVSTFSRITSKYCPKCAKKMHIYEKIRKQKERRRQRRDEI